MLGRRFRSRSKACLLAAGVVIFALSGTADAADTKILTFSKAPLPARPSPLMLGVGVHFGIGGDFNYVPETTAALIKELGLDSFRDDLVWPVFDAPGARPDAPQPSALFTFMKLTSAQPLLILGHSNPAVPGGVKPLTDKGRGAFADFTVRAAAATRPFKPIFEIWNEWNLTPGAQPPWLIGAGTATDPRAAVHYAALTHAAIPALHAAAPEAPLLVGAAGVDPGWIWTRAIVQDGVLAGTSGLSVHLYNHCEADVSRRTATNVIDQLSTLQSALKQQTGQDIPISLTEFGWPTATGPCAISRQSVADNIAQTLLWSATAPWLKGAWIYQLKDQGHNPGAIEDNFGLYTYDYKPKPAACAVREAVRLIRTASPFRLERPFHDLFLIQATVPEGIRLIAWSTGAQMKGILRVRGHEPMQVQALCNSRPALVDDTVVIGPEPIVLDIKAGGATVETHLAP